MKHIFFTALVLALAFSSYAQNPAYQKNTAHPMATSRIVNPEGNTPWPYAHAFYSGAMDKSGNLWFGSSDGIYRFDGKFFTNYRIADGMNVERVWSTYKDESGNIWFGVRGGIVRMAPAVQGSTELPSFKSIIMPPLGNDLHPDNNNPNSEVGNRVTGIVDGRNGYMWFAAGYNIYRANADSPMARLTSLGSFFKTEKIRMSCGDPDDFGITCVCADNEGNLLISLSSCCCCYNITYRLDANKLNNPCISGRCNHNLFNAQDLAVHNKILSVLLTKITREEDNANITISTVYKDRSGTLWMGSIDTVGVYRYDGRHFIRFAKNAALNRSSVSVIYEDKKGNMWFGTGSELGGNGVFRYNPSANGSQSVTHFTKKDGLCSNHSFSNDVITCITEDINGKIWFGGDAGVCYYAPYTAAGKRAGYFFNFTKKEGVTSDHVRFFLKDKSDNIWFGTWNLGLYRYDGKTLISFSDDKVTP